MKNVLILIVLCSSLLYPQQKIDYKKLKSGYTLEMNRLSYKYQLEQETKSLLNSKLNNSNEKEWSSLFRELELLFFFNDDVDSLISKSVRYMLDASSSFQFDIIELLLTYRIKGYFREVSHVFNTAKQPNLFAAAAIYLSRNNYLENDNILSRIKEFNPEYTKIPVLNFLYNDLAENSKNKLTKQILDTLFNHPFQKNITIIFSLHRRDRTYPGITIIRKPDGTFVHNEDGSIFHVQQLARSTSNLPGYVSQGNSPQGIYSIIGTYISPTESIGPTPNVLIRSPFEVPPSLFYHGLNRSNSWSIEDYKSLLPNSLTNYLPVYESFYAGQSGRKLIVMHGSTDELSFFKQEIFYPLTPSKGCLTTKEIWDEKTGRCIESDQAKLINAFNSTNNMKGFLVVLDLDDQKKAVTIDEILPYLK